MTTDLAEKLAAPTQSTGPATCNSKQLADRWGCILPLGHVETVVITGHQREVWVRDGKETWRLKSAVKL